MKYFIFRNYTVEPFFREQDASFSGYEDVSAIDETADAFIWFYLPPYRATTTAAAEVTNYSNLLSIALSRLGANASAEAPAGGSAVVGAAGAAKPVIVFSMRPIYNIAYQTSNCALEDAVSEYNKNIRLMAKDRPNVKIVDISDFYRGFSHGELVDWKFYYISQIPLNPKLSGRFSEWFERQLEVLNMRRKKCIVLDMDNTLWGGVLGEDGMEGIKAGNDYPGSAYRFFQEYLLELSKNGVILAACSKNNEGDVLEAWDKHPDLLLRKDNFVAYRINWNNKADNLQELASELNIGMDSMVFIDDSPSERELVRQALPQMTVPDFPEQPYLYPEFARNLTEKYFATYRLTEEDAVKTRQYKENSARAQFQSRFVDMDSYLQSLDIELTVEPSDEFNIVRLAQMTQKTNQFNLTTRRYTEAELLSIEQRGGWIYGLRVKDRFGDNGLSGLMIIEVDRAKAKIDTLLLSCRILGKRIEDDFVRHMLVKLKSSGVEEVCAHYAQTDKNAQVADFYDKAGFTTTDSKAYSMNLNGYEPVINYKITER